ncbi:MAG: HAD-IIIA family hydrolase [Patescibacteria group bacterium]|jgi:hypothetical protein
MTPLSVVFYTLATVASLVVIVCLFCIYRNYRYGDRQQWREFWRKRLAWLKPDYIINSLPQLDIVRLSHYGSIYLILDLDNTLCYPGSEEIDPNVVDMIRTARIRGLIGGVVILSNIIFPSKKREGRVARVAQLLRAEYVCAVRPYTKPHPKAFLAAMAQLPGANKHNTVVVGDQIFTDIRGARRSGIRSVLVRPLGRDAVYIAYKRWLEGIVFRLTKWR